jgi:hypothetical protein
VGTDVGEEVGVRVGATVGDGTAVTVAATVGAAEGEPGVAVDPPVLPATAGGVVVAGDGVTWAGG